MKKYIKILVVLMCMVLCCALTACNNASAAVASGDVVSDYANDTSNIVYRDVLKQYKQITKSIIDGTFDAEEALKTFPSLNNDIDYKWSSMLTELNDGFSAGDSKFGYALYDMNADGIKELFLINNHYDIFAIFTAVASEVSLLDAYWSRYYAMLLESGTLFTHSSNGAANFENNTLRLIENQLGKTFSFGAADGEYYLNEGDVRTNWTEEEYNMQIDMYPSYDNHEQVNRDNGLVFVEI